MKLQKILEFLLKLFTVIGLAYFPLLIILAIINTFVEFPVNLSELSAELVLSPFFVLSGLFLVLYLILSVFFLMTFYKFEKREIKFKKVSSVEFVQKISKSFNITNANTFGSEARNFLCFEKKSKTTNKILWFVFFENYNQEVEKTFQIMKSVVKNYSADFNKVSTVSFVCTNEEGTQAIDNKAFNLQDLYGKILNISFVVDLTRGSMFYSHMNDGPGMFAQRKMEKNVYNALKNCEIFEETDLEILLKKRIKTERKSDKK